MLRLLAVCHRGLADEVLQGHFELPRRPTEEDGADLPSSTATILIAAKASGRSETTTHSLARKLSVSDLRSLR